jgi:hypothetical protein
LAIGGSRLSATVSSIAAYVIRDLRACWRRRSVASTASSSPPGSENAAPVRSAICRACDWLGLELEEAANRANEHCISTPESRVSACVIKTDENLMIARHARALVSAAAPGAR